MTVDPSQLTDEQLRVLVAEACGWTEIRESTPWECCDEPPSIRTVGCHPIIKHPCELPDYLTSLDACADFERGLTDNYTSQDFEHARYIQHLENQVGHLAGRVGWSFALATATARQRCIAYLKVKGKS